MNAFAAWAYGLFGLSILMSLVWLVQYRAQNAGLVDVAWSFSLGMLAVWYACVGEAPLWLRVLLAIATGLWSLRLGIHLWLRVVGKPEDGRYRRMREHWGDKQQPYMFGFFQAQALVASVLSVPFLVIAFRPDAPAPGWIIAGMAIWVIAVAGEALADYQLTRFNAGPHNRGKTCQQGLWHYSRHPNYFFEGLHWFTYVCLAIGAPYGWAAWLGPVLMLWLLVKVTGIRYTEQQALSGTRRASYLQYQRTTSAFVPWFPRQG